EGGGHLLPQSPLVANSENVAWPAPRRRLSRRLVSRFSWGAGHQPFQYQRVLPPLFEMRRLVAVRHRRRVGLVLRSFSRSPNQGRTARPVLAMSLLPRQAWIWLLAAALALLPHGRSISATGEYFSLGV